MESNEGGNTIYPTRSAGDTVRVNVLMWITLSGHKEYNVSSAFEEADIKYDLLSSEELEDYFKSQEENKNEKED